MTRPADLFDRITEWADLERFVTSPAPGLRIGILYGRRRTGKSFLLRRLCREHGGRYHMAQEEEPLPALQRFADAVGAGRGLEAGQLRFRDWDEGLRTALRPLPAGGAQATPLLVIDELPYLLAHGLGAQIPSALQALVDESRDAPESMSGRVILCGSALAVMSDLLSGARALRGRAELDLLLKPFDYRTSASYYGIEDTDTAFRMYACFGGTPGYRDLLGGASPQTRSDLDELLLSTVFNPSHALFGEAGYLLREDPRIQDRALYLSVLGAVAAGATTPSKVAAAIGRDQRSLHHALDVLITSGFLVKDEDLLLQRRPVLRLADPVVRLHQLVTVPRMAAFEERKAAPAWQAAAPTVSAQILGPSFEQLAREWTARHAAERTKGGPTGEVGSTVVNDSAGRAQHELDVVALAEGERRQAGAPVIRAMGEAKSSDRARTLSDLERLDRIRELLVARGVPAAGARLLLFGRSGFDLNLTEAARGRPDVELVDLERVWHGE
ncbi:ATP-binding protein [Streptomyces sp. E11-3]|uniref:AAA family ATPase n=1 Tax=Streptomyces sp. E11-3 TaxID=3110112 RepID=UPI0039802D6C